MLTMTIKQRRAQKRKKKLPTTHEMASDELERRTAESKTRWPTKIVSCFVP
jgi:hypothetical protein